MIGELDIVVGGKTGTRRNLFAHNNVGLEVEQVVHIAPDSGGRQNACRTNERRA